MTNEPTPAKVRLNDELGLAPERALWDAMGCIADDEACLRMLRAHIAAAVAAERERCAVAAWNHYMDTCRKTGRAPTIWHEWCASDAIRGAAGP